MTSDTGPSGRPLSVTDAQLSKVAGLSTPVPPGTSLLLNQSLAYVDILTHLVLAHYVAQTCYESNYFRTFVERIVPGQYEGRIDLGNDEPGDGNRYRGRGAIQLTGKRNYQRFELWLAAAGLASPVTEQPELVATPALRFLTAAFYWQTTPGLIAAAQLDDVMKVTKLINGGANGLAQRRLLTERAIEVLG